MDLPAGIPLIADVEKLIHDPLFAQHADFNHQFLVRHGPAMKGYGAHWGRDPLGLWSRRWEYPFVAQRLINFAAGRPLRILDAGSGVTYFDYFLCQNIPDAQVTCCDYDSSYPAMFNAINAGTPSPRVKFTSGSLQNLPLPDASIDAICCISVLEHTDHYADILDQFARVLVPGGALVLTFDLSLDGRFELSHAAAVELIKAIQARFVVSDNADPLAQLASIANTDAILSTDFVRKTQPKLLPWTHPWLKGLHDLFNGHGWTGGFRSKSVFCMDVRAAGCPPETKPPHPALSPEYRGEG